MSVLSDEAFWADFSFGPEDVPLSTFEGFESGQAFNSIWGKHDDAGNSVPFDPSSLNPVDTVHAVGKSTDTARTSNHSFLSYFRATANASFLRQLHSPTNKVATPTVNNTATIPISMKTRSILFMTTTQGP